MDWRDLETFSFGDGPELADELAAPDPSTILVLRDTPDAPILACVMLQTFRDSAVFQPKFANHERSRLRSPP